MENLDMKEGKTMAIVSYLWWIGLLIAFISNNKNRNSFTAFHIRQSIGLSALSFVISMLTRYGGVEIIGSVLILGLFVLWAIAILGAIQGEEKRIPLLGDLFQDWFRTI